jgi:ATP-dependent Lon protease
MITRSETLAYNKLRSKILVSHVGIQTDTNQDVFDVHHDVAYQPHYTKSTQCSSLKVTDTESKSYVYDNYDTTDTDGNYSEYTDSSDGGETPCQSETYCQTDTTTSNQMAVEEYYTGEEKIYFDRLTKRQKRKFIEIEDDLQNEESNMIPLRFKILDANIDKKLKCHLINKLNTTYTMDTSSSEYHKMIEYLESLAKIPIGKYKTLPISNISKPHQIQQFLEDTRAKLNDVVYGHNDTKNHIIRLLAQWISNPKSNGLVLGIEGPPGCGKTTLVKEGICKMLGLPFGFIPLGGVSDGSFMVGHSYTYIGAKCGKIAEILMGIDCMNPILFFDELDKVSNTRHGEEIINILIHLTDPSQNTHFCDKYFSEVPLDLSKCLIVFSYNNAELINPILKDRLVTIKTNGYNTANKIEIAQKYMMKEILDKYGFKDCDICISNDLIKYIINQSPDEKGVRNLKRSLEEIISNINLLRLLQDPSTSFPFTITKDHVDSYLKTCKISNSNTSLPMMYI